MTTPKTELMSVPQYAKKYTNLKRHSVLKNVRKRNMKLLPHVVDIKLIGRYYLLEVAIPSLSS